MMDGQKLPRTKYNSNRMPFATDIPIDELLDQPRAIQIARHSKRPNGKWVLEWDEKNLAKILLHERYAGKKIICIVIVGNARTGKSTLLNFYLRLPAKMEREVDFFNTNRKNNPYLFFPKWPSSTQLHDFLLKCQSILSETFEMRKFIDDVNNRYFLATSNTSNHYLESSPFIQQIMNITINGGQNNYIIDNNKIFGGGIFLVEEISLTTKLLEGSQHFFPLNEFYRIFMKTFEIRAMKNKWLKITLFCKIFIFLIYISEI